MAKIEKPTKPAKRTGPTRVKAIGWLKAHGHKAADVDAEKGDMKATLKALHKISDDEWKAAGGK